MKKLCNSENQLLTLIRNEVKARSLFRLTIQLRIPYQWGHKCIKRLAARGCIKITHGPYRVLVMEYSNCTFKCPSCPMESLAGPQGPIGILTAEKHTTYKGGDYGK